METVVFDSEEAKLYKNLEVGIDQSLTEVANIPTRKYIENIFEELSVSYSIHNNNEINGGGHLYDWEERNDDTSTGYKRRFWIVNK